MLKCAIIQPSFLPWRGTFHIINSVDKYIVFDDVQYDKHGWRNRNRIKTHIGVQWITLPVLTKGLSTQMIKDAKIDNKKNWQKKMIKTITSSYKDAPFFYLADVIFSILSRGYNYLLDIDMDLLVAINKLLRIDVDILFSSDLNIEYDDRISRIVSLCKAVGANHYISGPSARDYIKDNSIFENNGIVLEYQTYDYPPYNQIYGEFIPDLSIIDLLFNVGIEHAGDNIWNIRKK
ncbi:MAG: WbqC family protein [Nitrospirae bacterium]|nr:WbqC family protein [Nitrospirota bacterium]